MAAAIAGAAPWSLQFKPLSRKEHTAAGYYYRKGWRVKKSKKSKRIEVAGRDVEVYDNTLDENQVYFHPTLPTGIEDEISRTTKTSNGDRYAQRAIDMADFIEDAFDDSKKYLQATMSDGHIKEIKFNAKKDTKCLWVEFRDGTVCVYFDVASTVGHQLITLGRRGTTQISAVDGKQRHAVGIRFWDLVRMRGHHTGAQFKFEYYRSGRNAVTGSNKRYVRKDAYGKEHVSVLSDEDYKNLQAEASLHGASMQEYTAFKGQGGVVNASDLGSAMAGDDKDKEKLNMYENATSGSSFEDDLLDRMENMNNAAKARKTFKLGSYDADPSRHYPMLTVEEEKWYIDRCKELDNARKDIQEQLNTSISSLFNSAEELLSDKNKYSTFIDEHGGHEQYTYGNTDTESYRTGYARKHGGIPYERSYRAKHPDDINLSAVKRAYLRENLASLFDGRSWGKIKPTALETMSMLSAHSLWSGDVDTLSKFNRLNKRVQTYDSAQSVLRAAAGYESRVWTREQLVQQQYTLPKYAALKYKGYIDNGDWQGALEFLKRTGDENGKKKNGKKPRIADNRDILANELM